MLDGVGLYRRVPRSNGESYYTGKQWHEGIQPLCISLLLGPRVHISIMSHQANSAKP